MKWYMEKVWCEALGKKEEIVCHSHYEPEIENCKDFLFANRN
jgi:hypothetical protein